MARFFTQSEVAPTTLRDKKIAVIGYGNQGRAQAINLRRAGYQVLIGNQQDSSWDQAREDRFSPQPVDAACAQADVIMLLLPDEIAPAIYNESIKPHISRGKALVFASGYNGNRHRRRYCGAGNLCQSSRHAVRRLKVPASRHCRIGECIDTHGKSPRHRMRLAQ
jgi:ketol-acid reductoisomerase